ncbi:MAG: DUF971 domain-containing protein [Pseudomonadota bacterium]|nr:DUF971 domain-containing protein [Pseudomonadota bacterium]
MAQQHPHPTEINLHQKSRKLEITFDDGEHFEMSCEYLRVNSPSAEVQGHSPAESVLQVDKEDVNIERIEPVGNYAIQIYFDDEHNTGIYSWDTLYHLGVNKQQNWRDYLNRLKKAGAPHSELGNG